MCFLIIGFGGHKAMSIGFTIISKDCIPEINDSKPTADYELSTKMVKFKMVKFKMAEFRMSDSKR